MPETVRTHVVLPKELLDRIDALVGKRERSKFIAGCLDAAVRRAAVQEAIRAMRETPGPEVPGWETSEAAHEWVRAGRRFESERERRIREMQEE